MPPKKLGSAPEEPDVYSTPSKRKLKALKQRNVFVSLLKEL
jgi:hypothetical protein